MELTRKNINKTIKLNKPDHIYTSVRKKTPKNYLSPTISSTNKLTPKSSANNSNRIRMVQTQEKPLQRKKSRNFSNSLNAVTCYYDDLNHFSKDDDIGYDIYGHFS